MTNDTIKSPDTSQTTIALVAVRPRADGRYEALVVGTVTDGAGERWRYAVHDLRDLESRPAAWLERSSRRLSAPELLTLGEKDLLKAAAETDELKTFLTPARLNAAIAFRGVRRLVFYRQDLQPGPDKPPDLSGPLLTLDTCCAAADDGDGGKDPDFTSRLILFPDGRDEAWSGDVEGLAFTTQVRMALNGHYEPNESDTRVVFRGLVCRPPAQTLAGRKSLWIADDPRRAARFDVIRFGFTIGAFGHGPFGHTDARLTSRVLGADVIAVAQTPVTSETHPPEVASIPLLTKLGIKWPGLYVMRRFGLRPVEATQGDPVRRLTLRYELRTTGILVEPWRQVFVRLAQDPSMVPMDELTWVYFTQDQMLDRDSDTELRPAQRLRWLLAAGFEGSGSSDTPQDRFTAKVVKVFNDAVRTVHQSLRRVRDASPLSVLPRIKVVEASPTLRWQFSGAVVDHRPGDRSVDQADLEASFLRVEPCLAVAGAWGAPTKQPGAKVTLTFERVRTYSRSAGSAPAELTYAATLQAPRSAALRERSAGPWTGKPAFQSAVADVEARDVHDGTVFELDLEPAGTGAAPAGATLIGALELLFGPGFADADDDSEKTYERASTVRMLAAPAQLGATPSIDARMRLPIVSLTPGIQDELPDDASITEDERAGDPIAPRRPDPDAPLLFVPPAGQPGSRTLMLVADETVTQDENHTVNLSINVPEANRLGNPADTTAASSPAPVERPDPDSGSVLVLDPRPFRVALVTYRDLIAGQSNEANEVAVWNAAAGEGLSWRIVDDSETVRLVVPPQAVGEGMEKNRAATNGVPPDVVENAAVPVRFGSHTILELDPSYFETRYVEPGWNLRRILGYPGQRAPGAGLKSLRMELAYGLLTRVTAPGIRVAELGATLGAPAALLADRPREGGSRAVARYIRAFRTLRRAEARRLAVDRLWSVDLRHELSLEDDVTGKLRSYVPPAMGAAPAGLLTPLRWPIIGPKPEDAPPTFSAVPDDAQSFPGGLAWAFESANILLKVYATPVADRVRLRRPYLSAYGGFGIQRALFDARRTIIETDTVMGRVQRYSLERIGRIGCLWNRAKHVIIYERSVVPSPQFYNEVPIGLNQDELVGRAVLRKVEEYVEILELHRSYPEQGSAIEAPGCVLGSDFKSRRIRVDSRWGVDVRREGWKVPLWNKAFAGLTPVPLNPDHPAFMYPKPQICVEVIGEDGKAKHREIAEPEKLLFYTSVLDGQTDDTDHWDAVHLVDFMDIGLPEAGTCDPSSARLTDGMGPAEVPELPGLENLTFGLVEDPTPVAITYGRQASGPVAALKNVTLARAVSTRPNGGGGLAAGATLGAAVGRVAANLRAEMDGVAARVNDALDKVKYGGDVNAWLDSAAARATRFLTDPKVAKEVEKAFANAKSGLNSLPTVTLEVDDFCKKLGSRLQSQLDGQVTRVKTVTVSAVTAAGQRVREQVDPLREIGIRLLNPGGTPIDLLKAEAKAILAAIPPFLDNLEDDTRIAFGRAVSDAVALKEVIGGKLDAFEKNLVKVFDDALKALKELEGELATATPQNPGQVHEKVAAALAAVRTARAEVRDVLETPGKLDGVPAARRILLVLDDALIAVESGLIYVEGVETWTSDQLAKLKAAVSAAVATAGERLKAFKGRVALLNEGADSLLQKLLTAIRALADLGQEAALEFIAGLRTPISDAAKAVDKIDVGQADTLKDAAKAIKAVVAKVDAFIRSLESSFRNEIEAKLRVISTGGTDLIKAVQVQCDRVEGEVLKWITAGGQWLNDTFGAEQYRAKLESELRARIKKITASNLEEARRKVAEAVAAATRDIENRARHFAGTIQESVREVLGTDPEKLGQEAERLFQKGSNTLRLLRAVGDPPKTDRLGFNRPEVAYVFNEVNKVVDMTPAIGLVNRVADSAAAVEAAGGAVEDLLTSFGIRLPASALTDQLVPDTLKNLDVSKLFPDFSGLKLEGLFRNLGFPDLPSSEAVKVRHGIDAAERRAWLEADINVPFNRSCPVLDLGPVAVVIDKGLFESRARIVAAAQGLERTMRGRVSGNWRLVAAGQTIVTFHETDLTFDETGHIDFKIQPERVELAAVLQFLTTLIKASGKKGDFLIEPYMAGGIPAGVAARLDMELPPWNTGVFGISDLSLHILFGVRAIPQFALVAELSVASKMAPFTLNVWILNGGGFLTSRLTYLPTNQPALLNFDLEVGILAGVGLAFSAGVVSGGVWLQVGCSIGLHWSTGGGSTTAIRVFLLARGAVDVAGLVTASIALLLEVSYDGASMVGSGSLRISVKISCFFTLDVEEHVEYRFLGEASESDAGYSGSYE